MPAASLDTRSVLLICTLAVLAHFGLTGGRVAVALGALAQGSSSFTVGVMMALFAVLPMLLSVHSGRWVDRIGVRRPMRVGAWLLLAGSALPWIIQDTRVFFLSSCATGIGCMVFQIACQNLVGMRSAPDDRMLNFARLALSMSVSGFGGPLLAGLAIDHLGHRWAFGLLALCPMIALIVLQRQRHRFARGGSHAPAAAARQQLGDLLADPMMRRVLLATVLLSGAWDLNSFMVPIYGASIGLSATTIGVILSAFASATFVIRLLLPWIQRRLQPWTLLRGAMGMAGSVYLAYPFFAEAPMLIGLAFLLGLALGSGQPSLLSLLHAYSPAGRMAEALGLRMSLINGGQFCLPLVFGAIGTVAGHGLPFWTMAALLLPGAVLTGRGIRQEAARPPQR
ncbi:MFS transporter [Pigmentiphaga soli]|uniref:MFS transporter n=1 Tax=Pigmentiphaga soli TaxID=1007095 RepID=A0ABP8GSQ1_9BURK